MSTAGLISTCFLLAVSAGASAAETVRVQVAGEWCFIKTPEGRARSGEAVVLIHGNGETVDERSSSWEKAPGSQRLMDALLESGYMLAQSNHGATPQNGMWGNAKTQTSVLALIWITCEPDMQSGAFMP